MANTKISALSAASALVGTETLPVVQGGATKKSTPADILSLGVPRQVHVNFTCSPVTSVGTWIRDFDASQIMNIRRYNYPPADADEITFWTGLTPGTWSMDFFARTATNTPILDVALSYNSGGAWTTIATGIDLYAATPANLFSTTTGIVVTGYSPLLRVKVNGKNASSTDFVSQFNWATFTRTA